jgi:hypothetical protein
MMGQLDTPQLTKQVVCNKRMPHPPGYVGTSIPLAEWVALENHHQTPWRQTVYYDPDTIR